MGLLSRCTNGYWTVNGTPLYVPDSVSIENDNIVSPDTGRAESGVMKITWVRRTVRKVILRFNHLTGNEKSFMHDLMQGREFTFTYYDNGIQSMEAYCGRDSYDQVNLSNYAREGGEYKDYVIDIIEK